MSDLGNTNTNANINAKEISKINKEDNFDKVEIDIKLMQKMAFIYNALDNGWQIKKKDESYIFKKKHNYRREVFLDSYLDKFISKNCELKHIIG
jgi:hypothetical protein